MCCGFVINSEYLNEYVRSEHSFLKFMRRIILYLCIITSVWRWDTSTLMWTWYYLCPSCLFTIIVLACVVLTHDRMAGSLGAQPSSYVTYQIPVLYLRVFLLSGYLLFCGIIFANQNYSTSRIGWVACAMIIDSSNNMMVHGAFTWSTSGEQLHGRG
jgi:hypothetical protein